MLELIFLRPDHNARSAFDAIEAIGYRTCAFTNNDRGERERIELTENPFVNVQRMSPVDDAKPVWTWFDFRAPDQRTQIRLEANGRLDVDYIELVGPEAASLRRILEAQLPHDDRALLYERAATAADIEDRVRALFQLALAKGPIPEPHVLRLVRDALADERRLVRANAIYATAYFEWPAVVPMLRALIEREPEADLVSNAQLVADDIDNIRPDRMGSGRYWRVRADLKNRSEQLWIRRFASFPRDEETSWLVSSIPQTLEGISLDDVIRIEHRDGEDATMASIEAKSGHRTLRVEAAADRVEPIALRHGVRFEAQRAEYVAIDIPPGVDREALTRELDARAMPWSDVS